MRIMLALAASLALTTAAFTQEQKPATSATTQAPAQPQAQDPDVVAANEAFQTEDWPAAAKSYQAALAKGNNARIIHFRLGYALHMQKKFAEALSHHLLAVPINNRALRIDALYNCACAHALLGHKPEALKYLQHAIDAGFADTAQIEKDTDLDSLRADDTFKQLVAGIGRTPRLDQQLNFLLGSWAAAGEKSETTRSITFTRPMPASHAIVTTLSSPGAPAKTGLLYPNAADRTWTWTIMDGLGTKLTLTGRATEGGGARFEGRESSIGGDGVRVRLMFTPAESGFSEKAEVSDDGASWRVHHETRYTAAAAPN